MPKELTHWAINKKLIDKLSDSKVKEAILKHRNLFDVGSVMPDTPYYKVSGRNIREIRKVAGVLHGKKGNDTFKPIRHILKEYNTVDNDAVKVFILGVLAHIAVDSAFHPFVFYFTGTRHQPHTKKKSARRHFQLEAYLDLHYLGMGKLRNRGLFNYSYHRKEIHELDFLLLTAHYFFRRKDYPLVKLEMTLRMHCRYQGLFMKSWPAKLLKIADKLPGVDLTPVLSSFYPSHEPVNSPFFHNKVKYIHPVTGEKQTHSVADLEKIAVKMWMKWYKIFEKYWESEKLLKEFSVLHGPSLYTGIAGKGVKEMSHFDTSSSIHSLVFPENQPSIK